MKCADVIERLSAYADGEVSTREAQRLREHIEKCHSCARSFEALGVLHSKLTEVLREPVESPDVIQSVMSRLPARRERVIHRSVWAWAAAACVAAALIVRLTVWAPETEHAQRTAVQRPPAASSAPDEREHQPLKRERAPEVPERTVEPARTSNGEDELTAPVPDRPKRPKRRPKPSDRPRAPAAPDRQVANDGLAKPTDPDLPTTRRPAEEPDYAPLGRVAVVRDTVQSDDEGMRYEITTTTVMDGEILYQIKETVYVLPPYEDAATIERPPLQMVRRTGGGLGAFPLGG